MCLCLCHRQTGSYKSHEIYINSFLLFVTLSLTLPHPMGIFGMIILGKPLQHVATWIVILGLTACVTSSQFLPIAHRFCIFWYIHQMCSAAIAQSSSKYCMPYYLFRSLFSILCFLVGLCCSAHAYALTKRLYNLVIMLFSVVLGSNNPNVV